MPMSKRARYGNPTWPWAEAVEGISWCRSAGGSLLESQLAEASGSRAAAFIALFATYYRSDLIAHDMESLREAVEELNGVSFRYS